MLAVGHAGIHLELEDHSCHLSVHRIVVVVAVDHMGFVGGMATAVVEDVDHMELDYEMGVHTEGPEERILDYTGLEEVDPIVLVEDIDRKGRS